MLIFIPTKWKEGGKKGYKDKSFFYLYTACKLNRKYMQIEKFINARFFRINNVHL